MGSTFKLSEITSAICQAEGVSGEEDIAKALTRHREFIRHEILKPKSEDVSQGKAALFSVEHAVQLFVLSYFGKLRFNRDEIRKLAPIVYPEPVAKNGQGEPVFDTVSGNLAKVIEGSLRGENWLLEIVVSSDSEGLLHFSGGYRKYEDESPFVIGLMEAGMLLRGRTLREQRLLPISTQIRAFLELLEGEAE